MRRPSGAGAFAAAVAASAAGASSVAAGGATGAGEASGCGGDGDGSSPSRAFFCGVVAVVKLPPLPWVRSDAARSSSESKSCILCSTTGVPTFGEDAVGAACASATAGSGVPAATPAAVAAAGI